LMPPRPEQAHPRDIDIDIDIAVLVGTGRSGRYTRYAPLVSRVCVVFVCSEVVLLLCVS